MSQADPPPMLVQFQIEEGGLPLFPVESVLTCLFAASKY
jgi:hypothetical protein